MNTSVIEPLLASAERTVERGVRVLTRQRVIIANRARLGVDCRAQLALLVQFERTHARHVVELDRLRNRFPRIVPLPST